MLTLEHMSNEVVWQLLGSLILRILDRMGDVNRVVEVEREGQNHPLIYYIEDGLKRFFTPNGGLSCPELAQRIEEFKKRDPKGLESVIFQLIRNYYSREARLYRFPGVYSQKSLVKSYEYSYV